jgi:hypothetical protein
MYCPHLFMFSFSFNMATKRTSKGGKHRQPWHKNKANTIAISSRAAVVGFDVLSSILLLISLAPFHMLLLSIVIRLFGAADSIHFLSKQFLL